MARPTHRHGARTKTGKSVELSITSHEKVGISKIELVCWIVLLAAAASALLWKHFTVFYYSWTDEQIHLYVARRMVEGAVLYRDIDSARPPLVLFPIAWLIKLGCSPLLAGRAMVVGTQLATAGLLLWGGLRLLSWRAGALAALLFLTSPEVYSRVHYTGIQLAAFTASACVLFSLRAQPLRAGLLCGLSLATDQHGLVVCGIVGLLLIIRRPRDGIYFAVGALAVSGLIFGSVWAMGGRHLWKSLFGIHLFHFHIGQGADVQFWEKFTPWLYEHGYLFMGAELAGALLGARRKQAKSENCMLPASRNVRTLLLVVSAHIAVVLAMTEAAFLYVVVVGPLLALLAGMGFDATVTWCRQRKQLSRVRARRASGLLVAAAVATLALTAGGWAAARSHRERLDERQYSFWPHILQGQLSAFQQLDVAWRVAGDPTMPKTGTIFGDPTIVSAVALHSGLRISGELADLNPSWIEAGAVSGEEVVSRIERDSVAAVITSPWFMAQNVYFRSYLMACYQPPKVFPPPESGPGAGLFDILVYSHNPGISPCRVPAR